MITKTGMMSIMDFYSHDDRLALNLSFIDSDAKKDNVGLDFIESVRQFVEFKLQEYDEVES